MINNKFFSFWIIFLSLTTSVLSTGVVVRLSGGRTEYEGTVEIFNPQTSTWGSVCDTGWDNRDATVVCRQQGLPGGSARMGSFYGPGEGPIVMSDTGCTGTENNLIDCSHGSLGSGQTSCEVAGVMCKPDIRLVGGLSGAEGRLELYNGQTKMWGTVCSATWRRNESEVVCGQLGMRGGLPLARAIFGGGEGDVALSHVVCSGEETDIMQCQHHGLGIKMCSHREDVGVRCEPDIRIVEGDTPYDGRAEVYDTQSDSWGTVCIEGWDDDDAKVVCKYLGLFGGEAVTDGRFPAGTGPIHLEELKCSGDEANLLDCDHSGWGKSQCDHSMDAGLKCDAPEEDDGMSMSCYIYRDGSVISFSGKAFTSALMHGKNFVASMGAKDAVNDNPCKFAVMMFFNKFQHRTTWGSVSFGPHGKNRKKYYRNLAFERRGALRKMEERGYLKKQTKPKTYLEKFPHVINTAGNQTEVTVDKLPPFKGWKVATTCPFGAIYRFKEKHPALVVKLSYGYLYKPGTIGGLCGAE